MRVAMFSNLTTKTGGFARRLHLAVVLATVAAAAVFIATQLATAKADPLPVTEIAPGVFVHAGVHENINPQNHGDIANIGFVIGEAGVAVVDSGNTVALGRRLREAVRARTDLPILYVINTHVHPDHIFGNAAFSEDQPQYVGHAKLGEAMIEKAPYYLRTLETFVGEEAAKGVEFVQPTITVRAGETKELDLGGRVITVTAYPTAHTDNDVTAFDSRTETLWAGDLLFMERVPSIDGNLKGWIKVIGDLKKVSAARVIPGHGPTAAAWPEALDEELRYFTVLLRDIRKIIAEGGTIEQAMTLAGQEEKGNWVLFADYNARNVTTSFVDLEWE